MLKSSRVFVRLAPHVIKYTLASRKPLERYVNGRAIMIGDAAHPMLPIYAQGGSTSIEDAATLETLLSNMQSKDDLHSRLALWQAVRLPRNATSQILSDNQLSNPSTKGVEQQIRQFYEGFLPEQMPPGWSKTARDFFLHYDAFQAGQDALDWAERDDGFAELQRTGHLPEGVVLHFGPCD